MMNLIVKKFGIVLLGIVLFASCTSVPKDIPTSMSALELKQAAQECTAKGNYLGAEEYYKTLLKRFSVDTTIFLETEFELAHVYIKEKKWEKAKVLLQDVLSLYEQDNGSLPSEYRKLAQIDLDKIPK